MRRESSGYLPLSEQQTTCYSRRALLPPPLSRLLAAQTRSRSLIVLLLGAAASITVLLGGHGAVLAKLATLREAQLEAAPSNDGCVYLAAFNESSASQLEHLGVGGAGAVAERYTEPTNTQLFCALGELISAGTYGERQGGACRQARDDEDGLDVVWTWTNGSEALMSSWRQLALYRRGQAPPRARTGEGGGFLQSLGEHWASWNDWWAGRSGADQAGDSARQFRDHDELRYSLRSALAALSPAPHHLRNLHLIVGDTPSAPPPTEGETDLLETEEERRRCAQVPRWLAMDQGAVLRGSTAAQKPALLLQPHSRIFHSTDPDVVPSFNSRAIESQMGNIPELSRSFMYLNDDFFLLQSLEPADISTRLTGPVLRFIKHDTVPPKSPSEIASSWPADERTSEWKGLGLAAHALDQRFGKRERPYVAHIAKTFPTPVVREAMHVFSELFDATSRSRFRGDSDLEVQTAFLVTQYVVEKHREALLWAFFVTKADVNHDGVFSVAERDGILRMLGCEEPGRKVMRPARSSLVDLSAGYAAHKLSPPAQTTLRFSSLDGYAYDELRSSSSSRGGWPTFDDSRPSDACEIARDCFSEAFWVPGGGGEADVVGTLKRVAFERPRCGDCVIRALVSSSGTRGLEAFLPPLEDGGDEAAPGAPIALQATYETAEFKPASRSQAISLIARYSYVVGDSPFRFKRVTGPGSALVGLHHIRDAPPSSLVPQQAKPAFLAINDDMGERVSLRSLSKVNRLLEAFFRQTFATKSPYEL